MAAMERATVGLGPAEAEVISRLTTDGSPEATALHELTGIVLDPRSSKAQRVHAAIVAGLQVLEARAEEIGYERLAKFRETDPEHQAWRASRRARAARRHTGDHNTP